MNTTKTISPIVMLALRRYSMPQYELRHVAAEIALHTDVSIADVGQTVTTFGRVQVLFVTPYRQKDPPVLFIRGQAEALRLYYQLWRKLHNGEYVLFLKWQFRRAVKHFLKHARLTEEEQTFALQQFAVLFNEKGLRG